MNCFIEKFWFGWSLAALLGLLLIGERVGGQGALKPGHNWIDVGPHELQRDNFGSIFAGPALEPGTYTIWVAAKDQNEAPYVCWRSYGPFDVQPGRKYLATIRGNGVADVTFKEWNGRQHHDSNITAGLFYLNHNDGEQIFGVMAVPRDGPLPSMVAINALTPADIRETRHQCPHQIYTVTLDKGKTYVVQMMTEEFDTYVMIEDLAGNLLAQNDERSIILTNRAMNSHVVFQPEETATYRIIASTFSQLSAGGNYFLTVREIPVMREEAARLTLVDESRNDTYMKLYDVTLTAGRCYYIDLTSEEFGTCLKLLDEDGIIVAFDEGGTNRNTRITFEPTRTGRFQIMVTSSEEDATGAFRLTVREEE